MSKKLLTHFFWIFLAFFIGISGSYLVIKGGALAYGTLSEKNPSEEKSEPRVNLSFKIPFLNIKTKSNISIGFVGDIIPGINAPQNIFSDVVFFTKKPDIMIGNFEGVAAINEFLKCKPESKNCYSFNGDDSFIKLLASASFDVLNIANNHFNDYGEIGQAKTLEEIQKVKIVASGKKDEIVYQKSDNFTVAIVGFSNYEWTTDLNNEKKVQSIINAAEENSNVVVVIFHGGGEGMKYAHTPTGIEWYLSENRGDLRTFAHNAIDAGADVVLGSGPHVLRGIERYQDKLIAYSLGNFASANALLMSGSLKTSAMLEVTLDKNGAFVSGNIFSFEIDDYGIPHPDLKHAAIRDMNELSKSDFGSEAVTLSPSGSIIFR